MRDETPLHSRTLKIMNQRCYSVDQRHEIHNGILYGKDWKEFLKWLVVFKNHLKGLKPNYYLKKLLMAKSYWLVNSNRSRVKKVYRKYK